MQIATLFEPLLMDGLPAAAGRSIEARVSAYMLHSPESPLLPWLALDPAPIQFERGLAVWREGASNFTPIKGSCELLLAGRELRLEARVDRGPRWGRAAVLSFDLLEVVAIAPMCLALFPSFRAELHRQHESRRAH